MKYDLNIVDYPTESLGFVPVLSGLVFEQANRLMLAKGNKIDVLFSHKEGLLGYKPYKSGLLLRARDQKTGITKFTKFYNIETGELSEMETINQDAIYFDFGSDFIAGAEKRFCLFCQHLETKEIYTGGRAGEVKIDQDYIYAYLQDRKSTEPPSFACFDKYLNEIWRYKIDRRRQRFFRDFYLYDDAFIINGLYDVIKAKGQSDENRNFEIIALYKNNGEVKWRCMLDQKPTYSELIGDKIYCYRNSDLIVVDANSGEILLEHPVGYQYDSVEEERQDSISVFGHQDNYLVFSLYKGFRVFNKKLQLVQEVSWPKPITSHCLHQFTCPWQVITGVGENIYFNLSHYTGLGALGILTPSQDNEPKVTIQKRPEFKRELVLESVGRAYKISIDSDDLDEVVSSGEYELKEIGQYFGVDRSEHDHTDPELNDHLIYSINKALLPEDAVEDLKLMVERVEKFFETFLVKSAKTGNSFKVELEFR